MIIYMIASYVGGIGTILFLANQKLRDLIAKAKKEVKVIVNTGNSYEITYAKIKDVLLVESGKKRTSRRCWIVSNPDDIKLDPISKMYHAMVDARTPFVLNNDTIIAAKKMWIEKGRIEDFFTEDGYIEVDRDNNGQPIKDKDGNLSYNINSEVKFEGLTINPSYVNKTIKSSTPASIRAYIDKRVNDLHKMMASQGALKSFMFGLLGAMIGLAIAYIIMKNNAGGVDLEAIVTGVTNRMSSGSADVVNATNI